MTDAEIIALAGRALRRHSYRMHTFRPVTRFDGRGSKACVDISERIVNRLVAQGQLAWGNRARSFVVRRGPP